jgi:hypothetical protein
MRSALRDYAAFVGATSVEWAPATGQAAQMLRHVRLRRLP